MARTDDRNPDAEWCRLIKAATVGRYGHQAKIVTDHGIDKGQVSRAVNGFAVSEHVYLIVSREYGIRPPHIPGIDALGAPRYLACAFTEL